MLAEDFVIVDVMSGGESDSLSRTEAQRLLGEPRALCAHHPPVSFEPCIDVDVTALDREFRLVER